MPIAKRLIGAALFGYAVLYILQVVFSTFYADLLSPSEVWRVMNYITAVGIIVGAGVAYAHKRQLRPETPSPARSSGRWPRSTPPWRWAFGSSPSGSGCSRWAKASPSASPTT